MLGGGVLPQHLSHSCGYKQGRKHYKSYLAVQWRTQKISMGEFIQWHMVAICIGVRCL